MQDRVPLYPGRVTLTPVSGQANTFDLVRADQPTQEGTPLNKASLLNDATAALYGLPNTAVPDDVLSKIKTLIDSANANANTKARIDTGSYTGTGTYGSSNPNSLTFDFEPKLIVIKNTSSNVVRSYFMVFVRPCPFALIVRARATKSGGDACYGNTVYVTWSGNTVSWYSESSSEWQGNYSSTETYYYIAIG